MSNMSSEEYISIKEVASRLGLEPKTIKNKMASRVFIKGLHYFSPDGMGPRFKWSAVVAWLEAGEQGQAKAIDNGDGIPMARGYLLGESSTEKNLL